MTSSPADRHRALPAPSASDALRLCGYNHPDLMLFDLGLPDAPGIDVLRQIRPSRERFDPELPVLVLSGRTSEADRLRGFEAGADDFLPKPSHYPELVGQIWLPTAISEPPEIPRVSAWVNASEERAQAESISDWLGEEG